MAREFELNIHGLRRALENAPEVVVEAAKRGMHDALDDWKRQAVDVAPIDKATLRRGIQSEGVTGHTIDDLTGSISANATERNARGGRFNYAYYIHEQDAGGKQLRTAGTVKKFLEQPGRENADKWFGWIEDEIKDEMRRRGW